MLGSRARGPVSKLLGVAMMADISEATVQELQNALAMGLATHQAGDLGAAISCYERVLAILPGQADAHHYLGVALFQSGDAEAAAKHLEIAVAGKPDSAEAFNHQGCALLALARGGEAETAFRRACALNRDHAEAHFNLGTILQALEQPEEACPYLSHAVALAPDQTMWRVKLAEALRDLGDLTEAGIQLEAAIRLPGVPVDALFQRSRLRELTGMGRLARNDLMRCSILDPQNFRALNNLARGFMTGLQAGQAARVMNWAVRITPSDPMIRYNFANCLLASGDLGQGWLEFRWRHLKDEALVERRGLPPEWDGGAVKGGGLLIYQEQGIGDELRFASCLADAALAAAGPCTVECDRRLIPLFKRSHPSLDFIEKLPRDEGPPTTVDFTELVRTSNLAVHAAIGDLPRHVRATVEAFPDTRAYLLADDEARTVWKAKFAELGPGLKAGFLWRTGLASKIYAHYFFDILDLRPVFAIPGLVPVNLQYDECEEDLRRAESALGIRIHRPDGIDLRNDLDDLAALISELDVVIGPMTSVLALAGAMGTRCIGMNIGLDWTSLGTARQPWTPCMTVVHKGADRLWSEAVEEVAGMVRGLSAGSAMENPEPGSD